MCVVCPCREKMLLLSQQLTMQCECLGTRWAPHSGSLLTFPVGKAIVSSLQGEGLGLLLRFSAAVNHMDVNLSQTTLAAASSDFCIKLADTQTMQQAAVLSGHTGPVLTVKFGPRGKYLVSTCLMCTTIGHVESLCVLHHHVCPTTEDSEYPVYVCK